MSETEKQIDFTAGMPANTDAAAQRDAGALLARLAAAETDATALSEEQTQALYRRALHKAGLTQDGTAEGLTAAADETADDSAAAAKTAAKKTIPWPRRVLRTAAVLAVMVLGGTVLVQSGHSILTGTGRDLSMLRSVAEAPAEAAPEMALDTVTQYSADFDMLPAEGAEEPGAQKDAAEQAVPEHGILTGTAENAPVADSVAAAAEETSEAWMDSAGEASPTPDSETRLLMAEGRLYRATAKTAEPGSDDRTGCIEHVIPAGQTPAEDGQANFDAAGAPYVHLPDGLAVLLDGTWVFFEPVE